MLFAMDPNDGAALDKLRSDAVDRLAGRSSIDNLIYMDQILDAGGALGALSGPPSP